MSETMIRINHMDVLWHEYTDKEGQNLPVVQASLTEKASIIGRAGIMLYLAELVRGVCAVL